MQTRTTDYIRLNKKGERQSPILTLDRVESITYALRLTPLDKYGVNETEQFLKDNFQDWIFSIEVSSAGKQHYHCVVWSDQDEESVRILIRAFLSKYFLDKPKRGDANKQYNLSEVENIEVCITYLLKDQGELRYSSNINKETIDSLQKKSYKKFSKEDFAKQLDILKSRFKDDHPKIGEMMESIVRLKAMYRQPINMNQIYQMCVSFEIHNDPSRSIDYVFNFLSRQ